MSHHIIHTLKKSLLILTLGLLSIVVVVPALLYVPFIQDFVKDIALREVKKSTGMDISVDMLRLRFPLKVELDGVRVLEASGDTMATLGCAKVGVGVLPLLRGEIKATGIDVDDLYYRMGTVDSVMFLTARVNHFSVPSGDMDMKSSGLYVPSAMLDGGDVRLILRDTVLSPSPPDTASSSPLVIKAGELKLRNVRYTMQMLPIIDTLTAFIPEATLSKGVVDMKNHMIDVGSLMVDSVSVSYFTPSAEWLASHPQKPVAEDSVAASASEPWTVRAGHLGLTGQRLHYGVTGAIASAGFDMNYIEVTNVTLDIDSLFNRGSEIRVPLRRLSGIERCGLDLEASGIFAMDSMAMRADDFSVRAGSSELRVNGEYGLTAPALISLVANAEVLPSDIETAMPQMRRMLRGIPRRAITMNADIDGSLERLEVNKVTVDWPSYLKVNAHGAVSNPTDFAKMSGRVNIDGRVQNVNFLKPTLLGAMADRIAIPSTAIRGAIDYRPNLISGDLALVTGDGRLLLNGKWNGRATDYDASLDVDGFPVQSFMPSLGVGPVTAELSVKGHGYNPLKASTSIDASLKVDRITYQSVTYSNVYMDANLSGGEATGHLTSHNPGADLDVDFSAGLSSKEYSWDVSGDVRELDLAALGFSKGPMHGDFKIATNGVYYPATMGIDADLSVKDLAWTLGEQSLNVEALDASVAASDSLTDLRARTGDFTIDAVSPSGLKTILSRVEGLMPFVDSTVNRKELDVLALQRHLPQFDLKVTSGASNPVAAYLGETGITFNKFRIEASNDSLMRMNGSIAGFAKDKFRLDTIGFNLFQHTKNLVYTLNVDNRPGTLDDFAKVSVKGYLADDKASFLLNQYNIKGEQGFYVGAQAALNDSIVTLRIVPFKPRIAYQQWTINKDNMVSYNFSNRHIDADVALTNGKSLVKIYTDHGSAESGDVDHSTNDDVVVQLSDIHLADWLSISPFAPPIKGDLGANLRFRWDKDMITGNGSVSLDELYYGRERVGSFDLDLNASNAKGGVVHADVALLVDSVKVITASGVLNDSTASNPFLLDFSMIKFPLRTVNPFLPKSVAQLRGMLNGTMKITGTMTQPILNGYLNFDSTAVKVGMTGVDYAFSDNKIAVDSNVVRFDRFAISGLNNNPLYVDGTVDARQFANIAVDLGLDAKNMMIVNSSRPRGAELYGKAYVDLDATVKGNMSFLNVDASVALLPETDVTYVVTSSQSTLTSVNSGKMVKFVQFNDTLEAATDTLVQPTGMALNLEAQVDIQEGSTINVDLSSDGKNKASIKGFGVLDYTLNPMNDGRLLGRFTINSGYVRYTPPLMSEKNFKFKEGSYVNFTGDMLNPTLNVTAVDEMKANVTQEGQNSRLVNFLVSLSVTRTLQNMNVAFDLSTNDDITIENELTSMSPEQRANQAMNLLIYNVYTGPGTKASTNLSGNPLFSFLESQINTWAANNIKGVDISFGIDQYDKTTDGASQTTTSYSYRVSKTLFNNRVKIVVGGNYSTDADADENFSQNLINDISFEYMLNRSGSMYIRLFRHVGYESILEGEVTQTGVGFVYRHKIDSLLDLFRWRRRKTSPAKTQQSDNQTETKKSGK